MGRPLVIRKFQRNLRDYGLNITLQKAVERLFGCFYLARAYRIYRINLNAWQPRAPVSGGPVYRLVEPEEGDLIQQIELLEEWLQGSVEARIRGGALCMAALEGRRVAGFNLVSFGRARIVPIGAERSFRRDAWSEQITVHPDYRGRGVASELRFRVFAELKNRGVARFYGGALALNEGSLALARKVGFREIVEVRYRKVLTFSTWSWKRLKS